jgi:hypothetical protein
LQARGIAFTEVARVIEGRLHFACHTPGHMLAPRRNLSECGCSRLLDQPIHEVGRQLSGLRDQVM